jgi:hypothetical protein
VTPAENALFRVRPVVETLELTIGTIGARLKTRVTLARRGHTARRTVGERNPGGGEKKKHHRQHV